MKGPGLRIDLDLRRKWECPHCRRVLKLPGSVAQADCDCRGRTPTPMRLVESKRVVESRFDHTAYRNQQRLDAVCKPTVKLPDEDGREEDGREEGGGIAEDSVQEQSAGFQPTTAASGSAAEAPIDRAELPESTDPQHQRSPDDALPVSPESAADTPNIPPAPVQPFAALAADAAETRKSGISDVTGEGEGFSATTPELTPPESSPSASPPPEWRAEESGKTKEPEKAEEPGKNGLRPPKSGPRRSRRGKRGNRGPKEPGQNPPPSLPAAARTDQSPSGTAGKPETPQQEEDDFGKDL